MKTKINQNNITYLSKGFDQVGNLFLYQNLLFREIYEDKKEFVSKIIDSGLIEELVENNIFPPTSISNYKTKNSSLIIKHQKLKYITYTHEWTFTMLKDAALTTLKVNNIAKKYGYQTIDAHTENIIFSNNKPYFVDLGSFIKLPENSQAWFAIEEFVKCYVYPLILWKKGYTNIAVSQLYNNSISHSDFFYIYQPIMRLIPRAIIDKLFFLLFLTLRITAINDNALKEKSSEKIYWIYNFLKKRNLIPFQKINFEKISFKIKNIFDKSDYYWKNYHNELKNNKTKRIKSIIGIIKNLNISSATDLASNQGVISFEIAKIKNIKKIFCIDYDRGALDQLYETSKSEKNKKISCYSSNIIFPKQFNNQFSLEERSKSDLIIALAVTHHLLLTQNISYSKIFSSLANYSKKWLLIEYMPLGLWNGKSSLSLPDWYSQKNFERNMEIYFNIIKIKRLEKNRILYVAQRK
jgi:hypothetical protein